MLQSYRISKYNPEFRDEMGKYLKHKEWTSFSEVGKKITLEEYMKIENKYVQKVIQFMELNSITKLVVRNLEARKDISDIDFNQIDKNVFFKLHEGSSFEIDQIPSLVRLALREYVWFKLKGERNFFVHFGYDYYIYVGFLCSKKILEKIYVGDEDGIFTESYRSPYLR